MGAWAADERLPMAHLAHYEKLVPPAWVDQLVQGQHPATYPGHGFVVFEVGWENATAYQTGHIPGARYFALETYEQAPLWTRVSDAALAERLAKAGVRYDSTVVLYGRDTTAATRAAVLLMYAGVDDVRVLDGGFAAWRAAGYAIETTVPLPDPVADFGTTLPRHPEYLIGTEEARALVAERDATLVTYRRLRGRDYSRSLASEPDVKVSLHPAQASQRPCEGPVSSQTTCWLHDTREKSIPLRGR